MKIFLDSYSLTGRSEYGNWFFFLLPFVSLNGYSYYYYFSIGWLCFSATWVLAKTDRMKRGADSGELPF